MKQITNASDSTSRGSERWLLLLVVLVGLGGLLLSFSSTPKEQHLELEGIQLEGRIIAPESSESLPEDMC